MEFVHNGMQSKLILLFMLEKIEMPLTEKSIIDICTSQNDWLNYMECKDVLYKLLESNFIYSTGNVGSPEERFFITSEGRECLGYFYDKIPAALLNNIAEYVKNNRLYFKKSQEYLADYAKNSDGSYLIMLKIRSHTLNYPMFEVKIATPSRQSAIEACKKWRENAHLVYEQVYESLINYDEKSEQ